MSTILRALKKLEKDSAVNTDAPDLPGKISIRRVGDRSRFVTGGLVFAGLVLAAGLAVLAGFYSTGLTSSPENRLKHSKNAPAAAADAETKKVQREPFRQKKRDTATTSLSPGQTEKAQAQVSENVEAAETPADFDETAESLARKSEDGGGSGSLDADPSNLSAEMDKNEMPHAGKKENSSAAKAPAASAETVILEDIGLHVQAISWNETPSRRLAVINSRLCREGEKINGYRILTINPDDVVVSKGEKTGKLIFNFH